MPISFSLLSRTLTKRLSGSAKMKLDSAIVSLLGVDPNNATVSSAGGGGMSSASTSKITAKLEDGTTKQFFMKSGKGKDAEIMFTGEHASLNAMHDVVPTLCPKSYGHGKFADMPDKSFLVTDFLELSGRFSGKSSSGMSLAQKLAKLHTTPAPVPEGYDKSQFGFPATTCCGDTPQDNTYESSWADFYANRRLRFIMKQSRKSNGADKELEQLIENTCTKVIPKLIGDRHLNGGKGITPVVVHGDLWSGNASAGKLPGMSEPEELVYDSSAVYGHSEFELGIMKMFGGFGGSFLKEYHELVPKTEPVEEYEDRVKLYELYHHLNHHALFGGGYKSGAVSIMRSLIGKYGDKSEL
ncbi:Ketosamine-3-kinase [Pseudocercospora fuligena]|uniref:protein-ribulosamine 3-kinase n=1 Tax=Pseudocercospora fuligena TaxID=685502 RepID=A0A8H6VNM7_9PEZI|nr:Ketosamine-3-kinase [Pseudocercospora fuligena]